jgi:hypothetical protein
MARHGFNLTQAWRYLLFCGIWLPASVTAAAAAASATTNNPCDRGGAGSTVDYAALYQDINKGNFIPLIPDSLLGKTPEACQPAYWNSDVIVYFLWKGLAMLNWLSVAAAIVFIIYGGLLYISAYASEGNAKKGKGVIVAALTGLVIVLAARYIVTGAVALFSSTGDLNKSLQDQPY